MVNKIVILGLDGATWTKLDEYENELIELMPDVPVDRGVTRQAEPVVGTTVSQ